MKRLSTQEYSDLIENSSVLTTDRYGEKVILLSNGNILKLFRLKRLLSSAQIYDYSSRFFDNAAKLKTIGILTVEAITYFNIPHIGKTGIVYKPLAGNNIRDIAIKNNLILEREIIESVGKFIAVLHLNGVYFRSLHLGNIVLTPEGKLGLIDIADIKVKSKSLSLIERLRNIEHLARYPEDTQLLQCQTEDWFIQAYLNVLKESGNKFVLSKKVGDLISRILKKNRAPRLKWHKKPPQAQQKLT